MIIFIREKSKQVEGPLVNKLKLGLTAFYYYIILGV